MSDLLLALITGYLLGSLPAGFLAGRIAGVDIRTVGSGNVGATNVLRVLGKGFGYPVFAVDLGKGIAAVLFAEWLGRHRHSNLAPEIWGIIGGIAAVLGHSYSVWLGGKGGKGVATSFGVLFALAPMAAAIMVVVWILTFLVTRYVSVASVCAAVALPLIAAAIVHRRASNERAVVYFSIVLAMLVVWRHRPNIARLRQGTEPRFQRK